MSTLRVNANIQILGNRTQENIIPAGKTWIIKSVKCFGPTGSFESRLNWNLAAVAPELPVYLMETKTPLEISDEFACVGDGVKSLQLYIKNNDTSIANIVGMVVSYDEYNS